MYTQCLDSLGEKEAFSFRYAPPILARYVNTALYPEDRPQMPFKTAKGWQCSIYYFWWRFLNENEGFKSRQYDGTDGPEGRVARDFGDLRRMNFPNWWVYRGMQLFCEPAVPPVVVHRDSAPQVLSQRSILLSVPVSGDIERALSDIRAKLTPEFQRRQATGLVPKPRYPVLANMPLHALYRRYNVWRIRKDNPGLPLYEVAVRAGAQPNGPLEDVDIRKTLAASCSRDYKEAETIIDFVGRGLFPVPRADMAQNGACLDQSDEAHGEVVPLDADTMSLWLDRIYADEPERAEYHKATILPTLRAELPD